MAMIHLESFEGWGVTTYPANKYTAVSVAEVSAAFGRNGRGARMTAFNYLRKAIDARSTMITGAAFYFTGLCRMFHFDDNANGTNQIYIRYEDNNTFAVYRNGTLLASTSETFPLNTWMYVEFKATISNGAGSYELRINGVNKLSATGINTQGSSSTNITAVQYGTSLNANNCSMDDWYIANTDAGSVTDFAGDLKIEALWPSAAGASAQFARGGSATAATNHEGVDEQGGHNSDVDYNYSNTAGQQDIFALQDLATTSGAVKGVQANIVARKDDAVTRQVKPVLRMGTTNYAGTAQGLGSTYQTISQCHDQAPDGTVWDISKVNSLQGGYECVT